MGEECLWVFTATPPPAPPEPEHYKDTQTVQVEAEAEHSKDAEDDAKQAFLDFQAQQAAAEAAPEAAPEEELKEEEQPLFEEEYDEEAYLVARLEASGGCVPVGKLDWEYNLGGGWGKKTISISQKDAPNIVSAVGKLRALAALGKIHTAAAEEKPEPEPTTNAPDAPAVPAVPDAPDAPAVPAVPGPELPPLPAIEEPAKDAVVEVRTGFLTHCALDMRAAF